MYILERKTYYISDDRSSIDYTSECADTKVIAYFKDEDTLLNTWTDHLDYTSMRYLMEGSDDSRHNLEIYDDNIDKLLDGIKTKLNKNKLKTQLLNLGKLPLINNVFQACLKNEEFKKYCDNHLNKRRDDTKFIYRHVNVI